MKKILLAGLVGLVLANAPPARAHGAASELSTLSALPVAALTVVAVETASEATVWVLERASDGARFSLRLGAGASAVVGGTVVVSTIAAGWLLASAGEALCFIPNELGRALLHDERITR
jgi:hypothetical protein